MATIKSAARSVAAEARAPAAEVSYTNPTPAQKIRALLTRLDLSQRAAAKELDVDERTMRYWCSDDSVGRPSAPRMAILALERLAQLRVEAGGT